MFRFLEFLAVISLPCLFTVALASLDIVIKTEHHQLSCVSITSLAFFCYHDEWTYSSINLANLLFSIFISYHFPLSITELAPGCQWSCCRNGNVPRALQCRKPDPTSSRTLLTYMYMYTAQVDHFFYWEELGHVKLSTPPSRQEGPDPTSLI